MCPEMSPEMVRQAQLTLSVFLRAMSDVGQNKLAEVLHMSETSISRMKSEHMQHFCNMATACGLKLVPMDARCIEDDELFALTRFARNWLDVNLAKEEWQKQVMGR